MKRFLLLLVALSIAWILIVFNTGFTGLMTAQSSGSSSVASGSAVPGGSNSETAILFSGYRFSRPDDVRQYAELVAEYDLLYENHLSTEARFNECYAALGNMSNEYDSEYGGKLVTYRSREALSIIQLKLEECQTLSGITNDDNRALAYLNQTISNKILSSTV